LENFIVLKSRFTSLSNAQLTINNILACSLPMSFQHYDQDGYDDEYYDQGGDGVMITMA
jgi:hypothetical protein